MKIPEMFGCNVQRNELNAEGVRKMPRFLPDLNFSSSSAEMHNSQTVSMAATTALQKAPPHLTEEELTDEQIEELLARATARLQSNSSKAASKTDGPQKYTFPKLDPGKLEKPYVSTKGDVATVDAPRLLDEKHRKHATGIRKVEDPVAAKKAAEEVCQL